MHTRQDVLRRGYYDEHLQRIYSLFDPSRVHVMIAEKVWADPVKSYDGLFKFLGIKQMASDPLVVGRRPEVRNKSGYGKMSEDSRMALAKVYMPHNEKLFEILGYRVSEWDPPTMKTLSALKGSAGADEQNRN